jgi:hypothetical protein
LARALELIERLGAEELLQVRQAIEGRLQQEANTAAQDAFHAALLASGLVKVLKPKRTPADGDRPLVPIQDRPLSETIREDRR